VHGGADGLGHLLDPALAEGTPGDDRAQGYGQAGTLFPLLPHVGEAVQALLLIGEAGLVDDEPRADAARRGPRA
jgi:hypothetical protein